MIIEAIINLITTLLKFILNLLPSVPDLPSSIMTSLDNVTNTIFSQIDTIKLLVPLVVVAYNFEHIYHFVMWLIKKLPLSIN